MCAAVLCSVDPRARAPATDPPGRLFLVISQLFFFFSHYWLPYNIFSYLGYYYVFGHFLHFSSSLSTLCALITFLALDALKC